MRSTPSKTVLGVAVLGFLGSVANATVIVDATFASHPTSVTNLNGSQAGLVTNSPGGNWVFGAGWDWSQPTIAPSNWNPTQNFFNIANLGEEDVALGVSISSAGAYTKPTQLRISGDMMFVEVRPNTQIAGLGFWSAMPNRTNAASSVNNFSGLILSEADTLRVFSGGVYVGSAVATGIDIIESTPSAQAPVTLAYTIDTATGSISDVTLNGSPIAGLSATVFTDSNTAFAGALSGGSSRLGLDNLVVESVPEPTTLGMAAIGLMGLARRQRN